MPVGTTGNGIHLMSSPYDCRCQLSCQAIHVLGLFCNMKMCYLSATRERTTGGNDFSRVDSLCSLYCRRQRLERKRNGGIGMVSPEFVIA